MEHEQQPADAVAIDPQAGEKVITLHKPVELGSMTYTELRLREPTAGEMEAWDGLIGAEADNMAISIVSGVPLAAVRQIGARNAVEAAKYIARFLV